MLQSVTHGKILVADAENLNLPTEPGELCRQAGVCAPIEMYSVYLGPAPEREYGGPRALIRTAGGRESDVAISAMTTNLPHDCPDHVDLWREMFEIHVRGTRVAADPRYASKTRYAKNDQRARKDRMSAWFDEVLGRG